MGSGCMLVFSRFMSRTAHSFPPMPLMLTPQLGAGTDCHENACGDTNSDLSALFKSLSVNIDVHAFVMENSSP
jgi:hypothetical protein